MACPPSTTAADIAAHLAATLSEDNFRTYLADPEITFLVIDTEASSAATASSPPAPPGP